MSKNRLYINEYRYLILGWDKPSGSFFYQLWNAKDEQEMRGLLKVPNLFGLNSEIVDHARIKLQQMKKCYSNFDGEPIILESTKIASVEEL